MFDDAIHALVGILRPRISHRGLSAEVGAALALPDMGGGSYVDMCAAFGLHSASVYRAVWNFVDAVNSSPANSAMERSASREVCGARVNFSGPFVAACVATPARSFRIVDNSCESS